MTNILDRREIADLTAWIGQRPHKPLVIRGARQVGKSTLVREFARSIGMPLVTADLERNPELREAFTVRDPRRILSTLALLTGRTVVAGEHILFLDEIQTSPDALASLRYFFEEMPELHVVAAGSLMDLALADKRFSMPVGRIEYLHLGPMSFEDFVEAVGHPNLATHLRGVSLTDLNSAFPGPIHRKCLDLLRQYWVVGGLPEAISTYAATGGDEVRDFATASRIQQGIVATYRDDFSKYSHGPTRDRMQLVFDALPGMVGRKFKYVQVSRDHRAAELADALGRLCMARVAVPRHSHGRQRRATLAAEINDRFLQMPLHGYRPDVRGTASRCPQIRQPGHDRSSIAAPSPNSLSASNYCTAARPMRYLHSTTGHARHGSASAEVDYVRDVRPSRRPHRNKGRCHRVPEVPAPVPQGKTARLRTAVQFRRTQFASRLEETVGWTGGRLSTPVAAALPGGSSKATGMDEYLD